MSWIVTRRISDSAALLVFFFAILLTLSSIACEKLPAGKDSRPLLQSERAAVTILQGNPPLEHFRDIALVHASSGFSRTALWICGFDGIVYHRFLPDGSWSWSRVPGGERLYALCAKTAASAWVAGWGGAIYRTTNCGSSWVRCQTPGPERITSLHGMKDGTIWAVGDRGIILRSTDGFHFGTVTHLGDDFDLRCIDIDEMGFGCIVGYGGAAWLTDNNGDSWVTCEKLSALKLDLYNVCVMENNVWAVGSFGAVMHSADRGVSWARVDTGSIGHYRHVRFTGNRGIITGYGRTILTEDGGSTWRALIENVPLQMLSSAFSTPSEIWTVGEFGAIFHFDCTTSSLSSPLLGLGVTMNSLEHQPETDTLWAVGEKSILLVSPDRGATWQPRYLTPVRMMTDILFVSRDQGWIVGEKGALWKTQDGGKTWKSTHLTDVGVLRSVCSAPDGCTWLCGDDGYLACSYDGEQWERIPQRMATDFTDMKLIDEKKILVVGTHGTILSSRNNGRFFLGNYTGTSVDFFACSLHGLSAVVVGRSGMIMESSSGVSRSSWNLVRSPVPSTLSAVAMTKSGSFYSAGDRGTVLVRHSYDNGGWRLIEVNLENDLKDILVLDDKTLIVCGAEGVILRIGIFS